MKKLAPLIALLAAPAAGQDARPYYASRAWPVQVSGPACAMVNATPDETSNPIEVRYDAAAGEVALTIETRDFIGGLKDSGSLELALVFLGNGQIEYDYGWGIRTFGYTYRNGLTRFTVRFAGERNVRQILADLAGSKHVGLLYHLETVASTDLAGAAPSIDKLRDCARLALAAN